MSRKGRIQIIATGLIWSVLSTLCFFFFHAPRKGWIFGALALVFVTSGILFPGIAALLHRTLSALVEGLATVVTWTLLSVTFYLVLFPMGLVLRMTGSLRTSRRPHPDETTYWIDRRPEPLSPARYLRPF